MKVPALSILLSLNEFDCETWPRLHQYVDKKASRNFFPRSMYIKKLAEELMQANKLAKLKKKVGIQYNERAGRWCIIQGTRIIDK